MVSEFLFVLLGAVAICHGAVTPMVPGDNSGYKEGDRFVWFPDGKGNPVLADLHAPIDEDVAKNIERVGINNIYSLYSRQNPINPTTIVIGISQAQLFATGFNPNRQTKIVCHGWNNDIGSDVNIVTRNAFLDAGDYNIIVVDWSHTSYSSYTAAVAAVPSVGLYIGLLLQFLVNTGNARYTDLHLIGHSLGAHIVGNAGRTVNGQVARITGLDPAGPLWSTNVNRIVPTDGQNVEIIHTDILILGFYDPCGDVDFYPNGGRSMPGCSGSGCNHGRAYEYFAATITYNHLFGSQCADVASAVSGLCYGASYPMGTAIIPKSGSGVYHLTTAAAYPY